MNFAIISQTDMQGYFVQEMPSPELLEKFMNLANQKGARFSHYTRSANNRITVHYRAHSSPEPKTRNFLSFTEAIEHIYVAYNLRQQYPFPRMQQKNTIQPKKALKEEKAIFEEVIQELYPEKRKLRPGLRIVDTGK